MDWFADSIENVKMFHVRITIVRFYLPMKISSPITHWDKPLIDGRIRSGFFFSPTRTIHMWSNSCSDLHLKKKAESTKGKKDLNVTIIYIYTRTFHIDLCMHHFVQLYVYTVYIYILWNVWPSIYRILNRRAVSFFRCFPSKSHPFHGSSHHQSTKQYTGRSRIGVWLNHEELTFMGNV